MSAEELKEMVRRYADEHHPGGWSEVTATVRDHAGRVVVYHYVTADGGTTLNPSPSALASDAPTPPAAGP